MSFSSRLRSPVNRFRRSQRGYILLTLMLFVSLMVIAAAIIAPTIAFEIRRDREEEMIHRGVQYSRAIRAYYKKFGRYPTRLEDLESTNSLRFLRKRYKDPITGKDFKLLHFGEVKMTFSAGLGGGSIPGANPIGGAPNGGTNGGGFSQGSAFGGGGSFGGNSGFGGNSNSGFGSNSSSFGSSSSSNQPQNQQNQPGTDPSSSSTPGQTPDQNANGQSGPGSSSNSGQAGNTTFGGGPIVGVVSTSKKASIREFNKKKKYDEWQFIYDPASDRGGLLNTPNQPPLQGMMQQGQPGQTQPGSGITPSGPIPGMMNNPNPGMEPNGSGTSPQNPNQ